MRYLFLKFTILYHKMYYVFFFIISFVKSETLEICNFTIDIFIDFIVYTVYKVNYHIIFNMIIYYPLMS